MSKISRERVGKEVLGMITGSHAHPERALGLLHTHNLSMSVFCPPQDVPILHEDAEPFADFIIDEKIWRDSYANASTMHEYAFSQCRNTAELTCI